MGAEVMKHVSVQELDKAIADVYKQLESVDTNFEMFDKVEWCKTIKNEVVEGGNQIFTCDGHYVLLEHGLHPYYNTETILVVNPQCDKCYKAAIKLASVRNIQHYSTAIYTKDSCEFKTMRIA
tara:strand:+ start:478 stop:846 length:369 start_codon:yes stop_codon:yes gene_type:complete